MKRIFMAGVLVLGTLTSFYSMAQRGMSPEQQAQAATETRQAVFKLLSFNMGPLQGMARGGSFDQDAAVQALERIATLAPMIPEVFAAMDTRDFDVETRALNPIWDNPDEIQSLANDLRMGALAAIDNINAEGASAVRQAMARDVGPRCGACHDRFRAD